MSGRRGDSSSSSGTLDLNKVDDNTPKIGSTPNNSSVNYNPFPTPTAFDGSKNDKKFVDINVDLKPSPPNFPWSPAPGQPTQGPIQGPPQSSQPQRRVDLGELLKTVQSIPLNEDDTRVLGDCRASFRNRSLIGFFGTATPAYFIFRGAFPKMRFARFFGTMLVGSIGSAWGVESALAKCVEKMVYLKKESQLKQFMLPFLMQFNNRYQEHLVNEYGPELNKLQQYSGQNNNYYDSFAYNYYNQNNKNNNNSNNNNSNNNNNNNNSEKK